MNDPHTTSPKTSPPAADSPAAVSEVWSEFYTDEEIAAMGDALIREDVVEAARRLRAYHARRRAAADSVQPPAHHPLVAEAEPERSAGPPTDQAEAETGWQMPVQRRGDVQRTQAPLADGAAEPVRLDGPAEVPAHHGGVDEFEGVPEARPQEVAASVAQAARRLVAAGYDPDRARALVADYVQDTSRQLGFSTAGWGLDQHDLDAIEAGINPPTTRHDRDVQAEVHTEAQAEDGDRARPHQDRPERDPVDPLGRARNAVAEPPRPTHGGAHQDTGHDHAARGSDDRDDDAVEFSAVDWADYPVEWTCCGADEEFTDTVGDGE